MATIYEIQGQANGQWADDACGATGPGLTRFATRADADAAIDGLRRVYAETGDPNSGEWRVVELAVDVQLESANGPRVVAPAWLDREELEVVLPEGWTVGWDDEVVVSPPRAPRRVSYPLWRIEAPQ